MSALARSQHDPANAAHDGAAVAARRPARPTTIFRGGHTREYTTLPNKTINDARLGLDELGALAKLLALPKDWQMHPWEIRRRWDVGRERYYRVIKVLMEAGYIVRGEMIRGEQGSFVAIEYLVFDEAQAVVDSAPPADDDDDAGDASAPAPAAPTPPPASVASLPHTGLPHAVEPHAGSPAPEVKKDNINNNPPTPLKPKPPPGNGDIPPEVKSVVPLPNVASPVAGPSSGPPMQNRGNASVPAASPTPAGPPKVEDFLAAWARARGPCVSEDRVRRIWLRRTDLDRIAALMLLPEFLADRARRKWKLSDAATYLRDRLWQAFPARPAIFEITPNMPEWHRWRKYYLDNGRAFLAEQMDALARQKKSFPSKEQWPPGYAAASEPNDNDRENKP